MAVPGTLQEKILDIKEKFSLEGLMAEDLVENRRKSISHAVSLVVEGLIGVVELREEDRYWMDNPKGIRCHSEWNTKDKEPMRDIHLERYLETYLLRENEVTIMNCVQDEGKEWIDRDKDEWRCEKCWKTEKEMCKRNVVLAGEFFGQALDCDEYLTHTYDPREKCVLLTCNSCQKMIEREVSHPDDEINMCCGCGICDLMRDDCGALRGRFRMSGTHDLDDTGEQYYFYNGERCPSCVQKESEAYKSMLWRSGMTSHDFFTSGWRNLPIPGKREWQLMRFPESDDEDLELTSDDEDDEERRTYVGEFETDDSEDEEPPRSALEIMDKVKDIGEILFDYQDKLKEGDYLKICNLLQGIVKDSNHL